MSSNSNELSTELDGEWIESLMSKHATTVDRWLKNNKTITEAYGEANREAKAKLEKLLADREIRARIDELERVIRGYHSVNHLMDERELKERIVQLSPTKSDGGE